MFILHTIQYGNNLSFFSTVMSSLPGRQHLMAKYLQKYINLHLNTFTSVNHGRVYLYKRYSYNIETENVKRLK